MLCGTIHKPPNLSRSKLSGSNMTAAPLFDSQETSHGFATQSVAPLYAPRVAPLEGPVGNLSFFATLLRNPLRILPAAVYEEGIVFAGRAGRAVCWITEPSLIKTVLLDKHDTFRRTPITQRILGPLLGKGVLTADGRRLEMAAPDGGTRIPSP